MILYVAARVQHQLLPQGDLELVVFLNSAMEIPFNHATPQCKPYLLALATEGTCSAMNVLFPCEVRLYFMSLPLPSLYK